MTMKAIQVVVSQVLNGSRKATKFLSPILVVKASRRHAHRKGESTVEVVLTIGKPNYAERQFIALCKRAGEKFPLKKVQIRGW